LLRGLLDRDLAHQCVDAKAAQFSEEFLITGSISVRSCRRCGVLLLKPAVLSKIALPT